MSPFISGGIIGLAFAIPVVVSVWRRIKREREEADNYISKESLREAIIAEGRGHGHET